MPRTSPVFSIGGACWSAGGGLLAVVLGALPFVLGLRFR